MEKKGLVFNIQRYSTHDGPGIRTTVFLKGCPLTCLWCSNPESQLGKPQLMVRDSKCSGCGKCVPSCPESAIRFSDEKKRVIDWEKCNHCFQCVDACLYGAITVIGDYMTAEEVCDIVEKDRVFYKNSGGGITVSGGEPLVQHDFLEKIFLIMKEKGIHRTLDTTGYAPFSDIEKIIPLVDLVLYDVKHLDTDKHKEATGVGNETILKNLEYISSKVTTWIRIPLIGGYNDSVEHISRVAQIAKDLGIEKVSFLPFHEGGEAKNSQIGMGHVAFSGQTPSDESLSCLVEIMERHQIKVTVGS